MLNKVLRSIALGRAYRRVPQRVRPCPLCGATEHRTVCTHDRNFLGLTTVSCTRCRFCFTNPYPDEDAIGRFYEDLYRQTVKSEGVPDSQSKEAKSREARKAYYADLLFTHCPDMRRFLDVGCGDGGLAEAVAERAPAVEIHLIEKNRSFLAYAEARSKGHGHASLADLARTGAALQAVSLIHVLEHFVDPLSVLREIRAMANEDTRLVIDVPDTEAYASLSDIHFSHPSHFCAETLTTALGLAGFRVLHLQRHAPPVFPKSILAVCAPSTAAYTPQFQAHPDLAPVFQRIDSPLGFVRSRLGL